MSTKDAVIAVIQRMPDTATVCDIIAALYIHQRVEEGQQQLDAEEGLPHEEATRRFAKWLV